MVASTHQNMPERSWLLTKRKTNCGAKGDERQPRGSFTSHLVSYVHDASEEHEAAMIQKGHPNELISTMIPVQSKKEWVLYCCGRRDHPIGDGRSDGHSEDTRRPRVHVRQKALSLF